MLCNSIDLIRQTIEKHARPAAFLMLIVIVLTIFGQVINFDFINLDDDVYVFENPYIRNGLTWSGLEWAFHADLFFEAQNADYWQPVTFISRMLDFKLFGAKPGMHHLSNVAHHLVNVLLLFVILFSLTKAFWKSLAVAAIFATHPLQVEAVAWVTARKDLLGTLFALLSLWAYSALTKSQNRKFPTLAVLLYAMSLMAKPVFVPLPILFLLLDYWPLERSLKKKFSWRQAVIEKWPFIFLSFIFCIIPFLGQPGVMSYAKHEQVLVIAIDNIFLYLAQIVYPIWLYIKSARFQFDENPILVLTSVIVLFIFSWLAIRKKNTNPAFFVGWFWFLFSILPTSVINPMANRFTYFPLIGFAIAGVWQFDSQSFREKVSKTLRVLFFVALIASFWAQSAIHAGYWKNSETYFSFALSRDPKNYIALHNLGHELELNQHDDQAIEHYERAHAINPKFATTLLNLAIMYIKTGQIEKALNHPNEEIRKLTRAVRETDAAILAEGTGQFSKALEHAQEALRQGPKNPVANRIVGVALMKQDQDDEALKYLETAVKGWAEFSEALNALAYLYGKKKDYEKALWYCRKAIKANPEFSDAHNNLGYILEQLGKSEEALASYQKAASLNPKSNAAISNFEGLRKELSLSSR